MTKPINVSRLGIGGPVGSGKTALIERLVPSLQQNGKQVAIVTNDILTQEDAERLRGRGFLPPERILGVETGACPHTVIREDPTLNLEAVRALEERFPGLDLIILGSGGDNLASTYSPEPADAFIFVIDVAACYNTSSRENSYDDDELRHTTSDFHTRRRCPCRILPGANHSLSGSRLAQEMHVELATNTRFFLSELFLAPAGIPLFEALSTCLIVRETNGKLLLHERGLAVPAQWDLDGPGILNGHRVWGRGILSGPRIPLTQVKDLAMLRPRLPPLVAEACQRDLAETGSFAPLADIRAAMQHANLPVRLFAS